MATENKSDCKSLLDKTPTKVKFEKLKLLIHQFEIETHQSVADSVIFNKSQTEWYEIKFKNIKLSFIEFVGIHDNSIEFNKCYCD